MSLVSLSPYSHDSSPGCFSFVQGLAPPICAGVLNSKFLIPRSEGKVLQRGRVLLNLGPRRGVPGQEARSMGLGPRSTSIQLCDYGNDISQEHVYREGFGISPWTKGWQTFSMKGQKGNSFGFAGHMVPVAIAQVCLCCGKAAVARYKQKVCLCPNKTLFAKTGVGWVLPWSISDFWVPERQRQVIV